MNFRLLLALVLLLATTAAQAQEIEPAWLEVADVALRLRSGPSGDDDVITQLTPREAVELLQRGEAWSQVRRQDGTAGWAHNDYLLPWDERNRPDARRRVGEQRLFRLYHGQNRYAELSSVSEHGYFYTVARRADDPLPNDEALHRLGAVFDERIYQQSLELWDVEDMPDIDGDERVVILLAAGFEDVLDNIRGWYTGRGGLPQEPGSGIGYVAVALDSEHDNLLPDTDFPGLALARTHGVLAHEFGHLLHHHVGNQVGGHNDLSWVSEGLATFTANRMPLESTRYLEDVVFSAVPGDQTVADVQLNLREDPDYRAAMVFMTYVYERLGAQTLLDFATHRLQGLDALDALLAERGEGFDADDFFADWVLANYLGDRERENGRFGYSRLTREDIHTVQPNLLRQLQTGIQDSSSPYASVYYELPLSGDMAADNLLLLDFRLSAPPPQDAWVQFVQVLPGRIDVQRFRAGDYPDRPMAASLGEAPQRAFVAISPFTPDARRRTQAVHWSLALRLEPLSEGDRAQVTTTLNLRSAPEIADNVLGKLQRCSVVQVLQRGESWSQVLNAEGLGGWAHNDWLAHRNAPAPGVSANPCAALSRAAHDGNLAAVQGLLAGGADVNGRDAWGRSALHEAAFMGHDDVIARLLRAGADVHAQDLAGRMPIDEVLNSGNFNNIQLLQEAGVEFDLGSPAIQPLVVEAASVGNDTLLGALLASGHDVNWRDDSGRSALAVATANGRERSVRTLIDAGADVTLTDGEGRTPFMLAAADGNLVLLERLHRAGVNANRVDDEGHNALTLAASSGKAINVAWLLLSTDVDVNHALPDSGRNALHLAAAAGHADVIAMLLLDGADADLADAEGLTPLQLAEAGGHAGAVTRLNMVEAERNRERPNPDDALFPNFLAAARSGNLAEVERLMAAGAPVNSTDGEGFSALMYAVRGGHRDVALRLLLAGADPDRKGGFLIVDESAIFLAITEGYDDLSAMMLLGGASGRVGFTPAMEAAAGSGREDVVRLLLDTKTRARAGIETRSAPGLTPLLQAASFNHSRLVEMLIDSGADLNARAGPAFWNQSALDFARKHGNQEIIDMLLEAGAEA
ncbi:MAG: ankyrin repeat domain-containing protein [Anaerolineaceae bacterium]|nr:ankyrin repeat domain-containing protein [Anaerolineaceae bacterium]